MVKIVKKNNNKFMFFIIIALFILVSRQQGFIGALPGEKDTLIIKDTNSVIHSFTGSGDPLTGYTEIQFFGGGSTFDYISFTPTPQYNEFYDWDGEGLLRVKVISEESNVIVDINAGDTIELEYLDVSDVLQTITIYLPYLDTSTPWFYEYDLYVATTGETYYDQALTSDACTFDNGCIGGVQPLMITDLTDMVPSGNIPTGDPYDWFLAVTQYPVPPDYLEGPGAKGGYLFLFDLFEDAISDDGLPLEVLLYYDNGGDLINTPSESYIDLYHDSTITRTYLPEMVDLNGELFLYVATTGETFYDSVLTQDACTFDNGCAIVSSCTVLRTTLGTSITSWISGSITRDVLGQSINDWVSC